MNSYKFLWYMKILFAARFSDPREIIRADLRLLLNALTKKHSVGVVGHEHAIERHSLWNGSILKDHSEIDPKDWDVFLVQGHSNLLAIKALTTTKPIIFLSASPDQEDQCANFPNLYHVLTTDRRSSPVTWGLTPELTAYLPLRRLKLLNDLNRNKPVDQDQYQLLYIVGNDDEGLQLTRNLISVIGSFNYLNCQVACSQTTGVLLKRISNGNISFLKKMGYNQAVLDRQDLIIASGDHAVKAVLERKKVIVVGQYGLGGLITGDNIGDFVKNGFRGRIGGVKDEPVPGSLLDFEIRAALGIEATEAEAWEAITEQQYQQLKKYYVVDWEKQLDELLTQVHQLYSLVHSPRQLLKLKPRISKNISIKRGEQESGITLIPSGVHVASIGILEMQLLNLLDGRLSVSEIIESSPELGKSVITSFIKELWRHKIIMFSPS